MVQQPIETSRTAEDPLGDTAIAISEARKPPNAKQTWGDAMFAFIFGVVPLVLATGAGAEMRQTLGTAVFSGMLGVTLFGIFLTPVFFYVLGWFGGSKPAPQPPADPGREQGAGPEKTAEARPCHRSVRGTARPRYTRPHSGLALDEANPGGILLG
jgi:hypothetical protein